MQKGQEFADKAKNSVKNEEKTGSGGLDNLKQAASDAYHDLQNKDYKGAAEKIQNQIKKASKLQGQTAADVGCVLDLVDGGAEQQSDRWQDSVFEHERNLALGVHLAPVDGLSELVFGTKGGVSVDDGLVNRLHQLVQSWLHACLHSGFDTGLDVFGNLSPKRGHQSTLGLQLSRSNPVASVVSSDKRQSRVTWNAWLERGVDRFHTERQLWSDALQDGAHHHTFVRVVQKVRIEGLEVQREVVGLVVVLDLAHWLLTMGQLESQLRGAVLVPAVVESSCQRELVVNGTLEESLLITDHSRERICWELAADRETMRDLENGVHGESLADVGPQSAELHLVQKHILGNLLVDVLHCSWVDQVQRLSVLLNGPGDVVDKGEHWVR
ncbi:hypothetical protein OGATHE_002891 [Ogataea polymorpha]|uniref:Uncharacterized protein n=1 Tax=Ogataea polymorpha TaxID=460523 RepID=A0A9P8PD59_9ASCO|nr:hypothetical protein OGATHE_002891 [Ogataea polymorpha]